MIKTIEWTDAGVVINGSERLDAQNVIWAAGVAAPKLLATIGVPTDRSGRVIDVTTGL